MRSALTTGMPGAILRIAAAVAGSIVSSKRAAMRAARIMRSLSSPMRFSASPMARSTRFLKSSCPPT